MSRVLKCLLIAFLLAGCAHEDLRPPCKHPSLWDSGDCGPIRSVNY
jgi:hypothetical protein